MAQQFDSTDRFVLFPNKRKETDKHPDLTGTINIRGVDHFFDAWITWDGNQVSRINGKIGKEKTGGKSGQGSAPRQRRELGSDQPHRSQQRAPANDFDDSDIPW